MKAPLRLLAKKSRDPDQPESWATLPGHTAKVLASARRIVAQVGDDALRACLLDPEQWRPRLEFALSFAAAIHDLGKAGAPFQDMVRGSSKVPQLVRHEAISGLLLLGVLRESLFEPACERDALAAWSALAAACGHHRKFTQDRLARVRGGGGDVVVFCDHDDFAKTLRIAANCVGVESEPVARQRWRAGWNLELDRLTDELLDELRDAHERELESPEALRFFALVRGLSFGADAAGSALPASKLAVTEWIDATLSERLETADAQTIVGARLRGGELRPFQRRVMASTATVTLVTAGCGTGKTVAAYAWAERHAGRKLVFSYPTTGTTSEGFHSYLQGIDVSAELLHSRAQVDLEDMAVNGVHPKQHSDGAARLTALSGWSARVTTCTADTVLGALALNRTGVYAFASLCASAFVFDEIHAYDRKMFGLLLRFLRLFPAAPVLLMTATLPPTRHAALVEQVSELRAIDGPPELENYPRYHLQPGLGQEPPWTAIEATLARGGKVLWVSNTVDRAVDAAKQAQLRPGVGVEPLVYHSRFRYEDRVARHRAVVDAFATAGPAFACTTQVCEMSLDLSADLLVTELAPAPALIQRLGRLNRHASPERPADPKPAYCLGCPPLPYEDEQLVAAEGLWRTLAQRGRACSQADLAEVFKALELIDSPSETPAVLCDGVESDPDAVRESGVTIEVVLARDAAQARRSAKQLRRCSVPILLLPDVKEWDRIGSVPIAPEDVVSYDLEFGARRR